MTRAQRIREHVDTLHSTIQGRSKWYTVNVSGLEMQTQVAILDSRAISQIRDAIDEIYRETEREVKRG